MGSGNDKDRSFILKGGRRILIHHSHGNLAKGQKLKVQVPNERDSPHHFGTQHHVSDISAIGCSRSRVKIGVI